jgi:hypothetical protein
LTLEGNAANLFMATFAYCSTWVFYFIAAEKPSWKTGGGGFAFKPPRKQFVPYYECAANVQYLAVTSYIFFWLFHNEKVN